ITNSVALRGSPSSSVLKACLAAQRSAPAREPHQQRAPPCRPALACSSTFLTQRHRGHRVRGAGTGRGSNTGFNKCPPCLNLGRRVHHELPWRSVLLVLPIMKIVLWPGLAPPDLFRGPPTSYDVFRSKSWMAGPSPAKARICGHGDAAPDAG